MSAEFTTHDRPLAIGGLNYQPNEAVNPSAIERNATLDVDNTELRGVQGWVSGDYAINNGLLGMNITVLKGVDWRNPPATIEAHPERLKEVGIAGEVTLEGQSTWAIEHQSRVQRLLNQAPIRVTSPLCQHTFCDSGCGLDINNYTVATQITEVGSQTLFRLVGTTNNYSYGSITFTSGPNSGLTFGITEGSDGVIYLADVPEGKVSNGDSVIARQGCAKTESDCKNRYGNYLQFLGVPPKGGWMPGTNFYQNPSIVR
jgi:uncharacterized phage protein (TIGR02218 family)